MLILLLSMLTLALAEPPVGDSYREAAQFGYDHDTSQQYLPPDFAVQSARISKASRNTVFGLNTRGISQEYGAPDFRDGLSQEYGTHNARNAASKFDNTISQEYGAPSSRFSQEYDSLSSSLGQSFSPASLKNGVAQRYGVPSIRNIPSTAYGASSQRSSPSPFNDAAEFQSTLYEGYNTPSLRNSGNSYNRNSSPVQKYGVPRFHSSQTKSSLPQAHRTSDAFTFDGKASLPQFQAARNSPTHNFGTSGRALSTQYGAPESRNAISSQGLERSLSTKYGAPSERSFSQNYGAPDIGTTDLKTNAFASSYASARSPSQEYGAPSARAAMPSQQHGAPRHNDVLSGQGYGYARDALDLLNQEPANYEFAYKVDDYEGGNDFGHVESRQEDRAEGTYFVVLPDGTKQIVEYEADEDGFKPRISVEPANSATALAADGPY